GTDPSPLTRAARPASGRSAQPGLHAGHGSVRYVHARMYGTVSVGCTGGLPCVRLQPRPGAYVYSASSRMRRERVPPVAWQRDVPESIRSLRGLARPDYLDLFTAKTNE